MYRTSRRMQYFRIAKSPGSPVRLALVHASGRESREAKGARQRTSLASSSVGLGESLRETEKWRPFLGGFEEHIRNM